MSLEQGDELGEAIHDGLCREVREETGLDVEPVALTGVYKNMTHGIIALVFRCKITGGSLITTEETADFRWADQAEIYELSEEAYAVRVLDALHDQRPPAIRELDGKHLARAAGDGTVTPGERASRCPPPARRIQPP